MGLNWLKLCPHYSVLKVTLKQRCKVQGPKSKSPEMFLFHPWTQQLISPEEEPRYSFQVTSKSSSHIQSPQRVKDNELIKWLIKWWLCISEKYQRHIQAHTGAQRFAKVSGLNDMFPGNGVQQGLRYVFSCLVGVSEMSAQSAATCI